VITLPTVSFGYSELYCQSGARSVASRKSGVAERSGERELQKNDGAERGAIGHGKRGLQKSVGTRRVVFAAQVIWTLVFSIVFTVSYF